jgi:uncharacterized protein YjdB
MTRPAVLRAVLLACFTISAVLPALSQSVTVSPASISFGNQAQGTTSSVHTVTLKNGQKSAITFTSISTNLSDYSETNTCPVSPATLAAGASCTISITFSPSALGARNATLTVLDTGTSSPQLVTLTGTGTSPILQSISVTPSGASLIAGYTQQFTATGTYSNGTTQNLTSSVTWSSSSKSIATVSAGGLATGVAPGSATITAKSGTISGSTALSVTAAVLTSIAVTPANASVAAGDKQQYTATGTYSNGTTQNLTSSATWSSSATSIATVTSAGLATGLAQGSATITAESGSTSGSTTLTVTAAVLTSIAITPTTASVAAGYTQQYTATGTYSNNTTQNLTSSATWTSSATSIATVSSGGLATGIAQGSATITAKSGTISGSTKLTVTAPLLTSISVTPNTASVAAGNSQQFTATATYSNGTTQNLSSAATWTSSKTSVATVKSTGIATGVTAGTATITAKSGTISGSATLTVTAAVLTSISVTPASASVAAGYTQQYTATGTYSNGTTQNLTSSATWSSSATSVATVSSGGLAIGVAQGAATITAKSGTISGSTVLTVTTPVLTSISISPTTASVAAGYTEQYTATGTYSNGTTQNLTGSATWSSSATSIATVSSGGLATSVAQGSATITAASGTISGSATLTVTAAVLTSISVTPNLASVAAGQSQQFTATGTYSNGTTQNLTGSSTWISSTTSVATVNSSGFATSAAQGSVTITVTSGTISGSANLSVTAPVLTSLSVSPASASIADGTIQQFTATGTYSDGSAQDLTSTVSWSSSSTSATIAAGGLATGASVGAATITATDGSITASAALTVGQPVLVSIAVTPAGASFALGTTQPLIATGTYSDGSTLVLTTSASWTTADSTIATVNGQGIAESVAVGSTSVTATVGSISGSTTVNITAAVLVSIAVTPAIPTLPLGTTQQFTATGTYTDGSTQNITGTVQWSSDTTATATISTAGVTTGLATSIGEGTANITATSGSISGSTTLTVTAAALVSIAVTPATPSIALGTTQQFTATGTYTDGSIQNLTSMAQWSSDTPATATIGTTGATMGLATSVAQGTANITATSGAISGSTLLTVTPAALVSIAINPPTATIALGTTQQFTATGTFTDGTTQDLTQSGHWSSTVATVATISNTVGTAGLATTLTVGTTTIGISSGTVSATATLVVNPAALVSIAISPQAPTIALGTTQQFTAMGTYTDGSMQDLTSVATWASSNAMIAIMNNTVGSYGLATSSGQGTATISATSGSISNSTTLTVSGPTLVSIAVTPSSIAISLGYGEQFTATATYSDGSIQDITQSATWASSNPAVATVTSGYAASVYPGTTTISASSGSFTGGAVLVVNPAVAISLVVTPASSSVFIGAAQQFTATLNYSNGTSQNVSSTVTWTSLNPAVATISGAGLALGVAGGSGTVEAAWGSNLFTATATITVLPSIPAWPTFAIDLNSSSMFPGVAGAAGPTSFGGLRLWDTPGSTWPFIETSNNVFNFATVDNILATAKNAGILYAQAGLARTPYFATSTAGYTDGTTCFDYVAGGNLTNQAPGQCDPPSDLSSNGTGANLYWRNWVAAYASHVNASGYSNTHARIRIWEIWNEPYSAKYWSTKYGTYDQLIRMEQDAYCIIKGGSFTINATGESCATVRSTVTSVALSGPIDPTAEIAMPSFEGQSPGPQAAQNFLYCNDNPATSCHTGGAEQADVMNFHLKPGNNAPAGMESVMSEWTANITGILQSAELAKPLYNTEGGYSANGWTCPPSPAGFCYTDANMQASYIARFYLYSYSLGITNSVWYDWAPSLTGIGSTSANTAYNQVYSWMVGSSFGSCSVNGTVWTCTLTLANGVAAAAIWDTSQTCTPCTTMNQTVGGSYLSYLGLLTGGTKTTIVNQTVPVGIQPILVQAQ